MTKIQNTNDPVVETKMMRAALIVLNQNTELGLYCPDLLKQQSRRRHSDKRGHNIPISRQSTSASLCVQSNGEPADTNCIAFGLSE